MNILSDDQQARVRFACRLWSTGDIVGAPAAASVRAAYNLIDDVVASGTPASQEDFKRMAAKVINNNEN